ncbi:MAG: UbiA family prenyltransferase [Accumulibacter sp.]|uniref:UbiA family prenyltransferase n=1 Tax=Accumulibacter sp. TaxID=2053492 RepID=UPI00331542EB
MSDQESCGLPLCVDLDGTLLRTDLTAESLLALGKHNPLGLFGLMPSLRRGKAAFKLALADQISCDPSRLPYNCDVLAMLQVARAEGRRTVLVSASPRSWVDAVARHLDLFDDVLATDDVFTNLSGLAKAERLVRHYGEQGFDYAGNARSDLHVWRCARKAIVVTPDHGVLACAKSQADVDTVFDDRPPRLWTWLKAMRLYQWAKNLLVFVPLLGAHAWANTAAVTQVCLAFLIFGLAASSVYLLNDLLDLDEDRRHPRKRLRPFASGMLPVAHGVVATLLLLASAVLLAGLLSPGFRAALATYYAVTLAYSFYLKKLVLIDILVLAGLYTVRLIAGGAAVNLGLSFWLLAFSVFLFMSLALVKRYTELLVQRDAGALTACGRGYHVDDFPLLQSMGVVSGYMSVLVLALYINSDTGRVLYSHIEFIWFLCLLLLFWISRVWLLAHRGQMHDDPLVFALKDRSSRAIALIAVVAVGLAL